MTSAVPHASPFYAELEAVALALDDTVLELLGGGPDRPDVGERIRVLGGEYAEDLVPGVTRAEAVVAAAVAMLHGGFTTTETEALRLAADRKRAGDDASFGGHPGAAVRDLSPPPISDPEVDLPPLPIDKIVRYQALDAEVDRLTAELKETKKHKAELELELVDAFTASETPRTTVRGKTVHLQRTLVASKAPGVETPQLVAALEEAGLADLITRNTVMANTLNAYVRELEKAGKDLPPALQGLIATFEKIEVRVNTTGRSS